MIKVNKTPKFGFSYNQVSNHNFNLALLTEDNQVLHTPVMCKDYFQDIFWCEHSGKDDGIYGLKWKSGSFDVTQERFKILLMGGGVKISETQESLQSFINEFDKAQGFSLSVIHQTGDDEELVVEFSKDWTSSGPLLSALTTIIRLGGAYESGDVKEFLSNMHGLISDHMEEIERGNTPDMKVEPEYAIVEVARLLRNYEKLLGLLAGKKIDFGWGNIGSIRSAHYMGIYEYKDFPTSKN